MSKANDRRYTRAISEATEGTISPALSLADAKAVVSAWLTAFQESLEKQDQRNPGTDVPEELDTCAIQILRSSAESSMHMHPPPLEDLDDRLATALDDTLGFLDLASKASRALPFRLPRPDDIKAAVNQAVRAHLTASPTINMSLLRSNLIAQSAQIDLLLDHDNTEDSDADSYDQEFEAIMPLLGLVQKALAIDGTESTGNTQTALRKHCESVLHNGYELRVLDFSESSSKHFRVVEFDGVADETLTPAIATKKGTTVLAGEARRSHGDSRPVTRRERRTP